MKCRGHNLVELLVVLLITGILLAGFQQVFMSMATSSKFTTEMPTIQQGATDAVRILADSLRGATSCIDGDASCTLGAVLESPAADGVTVYRRAAGGALEKHVFAVVGGDLVRTVSGNTVTVVKDATLSMVYYRSDSYNSSSLTVSGTPSSELPNLIAVRITASVSRNGLGSTNTTLIRLRNSPTP